MKSYFHNQKKTTNHETHIPFIFCLVTNFLIGQDEVNIPELFEQWEPVPEVINPGDANTAPSDAIVLFDGTSLDAWEQSNGDNAAWIIEDGVLTVKPGTGGIFTKQSFGDCQLHIEWRSPREVTGEGQGRGNSGIFFQNKYEVQVLDSYNNTTYPNGQAGSIYKQHIPLVNASRGPGEWQAYDIIFTAPKFDENGYRTSPGLLTVLHNGILIQHNSTLYGTTEYNRAPQNAPHGDGPIQLQDHSNPVSFRNIWIRKL